ncbi:hypothetical protein DAH64_06795 [Sphingomonas koreensis]|nr:hypothetical protein DAH64_06795 [Sphingomonas koreensis]
MLEHAAHAARETARLGTVEDHLGHGELAFQRLTLRFIVDADGEAVELVVVDGERLRSDRGGKRRVIGIVAIIDKRLELGFGRGSRRIDLKIGKRFGHGRNLLRFRRVIADRLRGFGLPGHTRSSRADACGKGKCHSRDNRGASGKGHSTSILCGWRAIRSVSLL